MGKVVWTDKDGNVLKEVEVEYTRFWAKPDEFKKFAVENGPEGWVYAKYIEWDTRLWNYDTFYEIEKCEDGSVILWLEA